MKLGIFGGSFDPVHNGHLALARACQAAAALDEIWFTPTAIQPLKRHGPQASNSDRAEMLELALRESSREPERPVPRSAPLTTWRVCTLELDRSGVSYTVDTLLQIHTELPDAKLFFLVGADAARDVPHWKQPTEIFRLATPLVVHRAGAPPADLAVIARFCPFENQPQLVEMPAIDISSSEIRRRIRLAEPLDDLVPRAVADYIVEQGLYRH